MTELDTSMISELEQKAHAGDTEAQAELDFYYDIFSLKRDKEIAFQHLNEAAEQGLADAQLALGLYYFQGENGELANHEHHPFVERELIRDHHICRAFYFILTDKKADANDVYLAFTWFEKSAKQGLAPAQYLLACCYRDGIGVKQNDELAFAWFKKAAEQDFAAAQCDVAYCYHIGKGVGQHDGLALAWTNKAVEQTDAVILRKNKALEQANAIWSSDGWDKFYSRDKVYSDWGEPSAEYEKFEEIYHACLEQDDTPYPGYGYVPKAYWLLGELYAQGKGIEQSSETAFKWYEKAADLQVIEAQYQLGVCYLEGNGVEKNYELGMKWLIKTANQNHPAARTWWENALLRSAFSDFDKENAEQYYQSAEAQYHLAACYFEGSGVEKNHELDMKSLKRSAMQGDHPAARTWLENALLRSAFPDFDKENAEQYYQSAEAQYHLAVCYFEGKGVEKNHRRGMKWLIKAAIQNHPAANAWLENALLRLAFPYINEENAEQGYQFAFDWCTKEAQLDSCATWFCLGILYAFGKGVEQDDKSAYLCFRKAVEHLEDDGSRDIIAFVLGICYAQGKGVNKDIEKAERYFEGICEYKISRILIEERRVKTGGVNGIQIVPIPLLIVKNLLSKNEFDLVAKYVKKTPMDRHNRDFFLAAFTELDKAHRVIEQKNQQLQEKDKELEDMMSMFAHKFRSPLDAIIYNTTHGNQVKLYTEAAQTMRGLLDVFSIISTDAAILKKKLSADNQGKGCLLSVLGKTLDMILLHVLSFSSREKIRQHYMAYAKAHGLCAADISRKVWREDYFDLEQSLQAEWEQRFAALLNQSAPLNERLDWLAQHFFTLEVRGFDRNDIVFEEYGITESFLTIVLNEMLVNVFKYYASDNQQPVILEWTARDDEQVLICRNPSIGTERTIFKGSQKGHTFLSALARNIGSQFTKPTPQDDFAVEFRIPNAIVL